jgi:hypothetical protein
MLFKVLFLIVSTQLRKSYILVNGEELEDEEGFYKLPAFLKDFNNIKADYQYNIYNKPTVPSNEFIKGWKECDDLFEGCFWIGPLSVYCGCATKTITATLKFDQINPKIIGCPFETCFISKTEVTDRTVDATLTLGGFEKLLEVLKLTSTSLTFRYSQRTTVTLREDITQKRGQKCVLLGGTFYWEFAGDLTKYCDNTLGTQCIDASQYEGNYSGFKTFIVPVDNSDFMYCYDISDQTQLIQTSLSVPQLTSKELVSTKSEEPETRLKLECMATD